MKNIMLSIGAVFLMITTYICGLGVCKASASLIVAKQSSLLRSEEPKEVTLKIVGMSCAGCANHIHTALSKTEGVISDKVNYPGNVAIVKYDASKISVDQIIKLIEKTGYKAEVQSH
jgi:periplasmic mercuric ion binding protein